MTGSSYSASPALSTSNYSHKRPLASFPLLSFDVYGTLIDFETSFYTAMQPLLSRVASPPSKEELLRLYLKYDPEVQRRQPKFKGSEILVECYKEIAKELGTEIGEKEGIQFRRMIQTWKLFADTIEALKELKSMGKKLVFLTNMDTESLKGNMKNNGLDQGLIDAVYSSEEIGTYKPDEKNFLYLRKAVKEAFGVEEGDILHVAQNVINDHVPAKRLGFWTVWVNRRGINMENVGGEALAKVDWEFATLADLVQEMKRELGRNKHMPAQESPICRSKL